MAVPIYRRVVEPAGMVSTPQSPASIPAPNVLGRLGRILERVSAELAAEVQARDRIKLDSLYAEARARFAARADELVREPAEGAAQTLEREIQTWLEGLARDPDAGRVLADLRRRIDPLRAQLAVRVKGAELEAVRQKRIEAMQAWARNAENAAYTDPTAAPELLAQAERTVRELDLPSAQRDQILAEARRRVARAALMRRVEKAPHEVLDLVQRGEGVAAFLEVQERHRLATTAQATIERRRREEEIARIKAEREAQRAAEKARREAARALEARMADELARRADGVAVPKPLVLDDFLAASDDAESARAAWMKFRAEAELRDAVAMVRGAPVEEIARLLERFQPDPEAPDYAGARQRFETLRKAIDRDMRARAADPLGYTLRTDPELAGALDALLRGEADADSVFADLDAAQARLGIPPDRRRLLPGPVANQLVGRVAAAATVDDRLAALEVVARIPSRWRAKVEAELVDAGLPKTVLPAVEALREGEPERARLLLSLPDYKPKLDRELGRELDEILRGSELARELERAASLAAAAGDARPLTDAHGLMELARKAAAMRIEAGVDPETAVADAIKTVLGRRRPVVSESAAVSIPADIDPDIAAAVLEDLKNRSLSALDETMLDRLIDGAFGDVPDGELRRRMARAVLSDLGRAARWLDDGEGGYRLVVPVPDATGAITWRAVPGVRATPDDLRAAVVQGLAPATPPEVFVP